MAVHLPQSLRHTLRTRFLAPSSTRPLFSPSTTSITTRLYSKMPSPTDTRPVVISGPSGVGKGTLINRLFAKHPETFCLSVSHTTRNPRAGENNGEHYHFVPMAEFEDLIAKDGFVEHAKFGGNRYGTSKQTIADQTASGRVVVLDIEMEGVKQIQEQRARGGNWQARYVFIAPPSNEILEQRLRGRGTETEESIQKRLTQALKELEYSKTPGVHDIIIVNDDLDKAFAELEGFIYKPAESK